MSYLAHVQETGLQQAHRRMWTAALAAVIAGQVFAFWLVCSHQVRKAEARHTEAVVQQMALADCLQYIPGSTIASCTSRKDDSVQPTATTKQALSGAVPVSFSFR